MESIKNFFSKASVQWGLILASVAGVAGYFFATNDFSRPALPDPEKPQDFTAQINKLDPEKPVGVFIFNVKHNDITNELLVNPSRNNYKEEMQKHYGDNMVVIDNPSMSHLKQFSEQFNAKFADKDPQVHFMANHHQGTYKDKYFAEFMGSVKGKNKRALVLACGPDSSCYNIPGFDYVMIPRPDGQILGPQVSLEISPAYKESIGWMRNISDPQEAQKKFSESNFSNTLNIARDKAVNWGASMAGHNVSEYQPPLVITPPTNLPAAPSKPNRAPLGSF